MMYGLICGNKALSVLFSGLPLLICRPFGMIYFLIAGGGSTSELAFSSVDLLFWIIITPLVLIYFKSKFQKKAGE